MASRSRTKRGRQGNAVGSSQPAVTEVAPVTEHSLVKFRDNPQRDRFVAHMGKKVNPTRFLSRAFMRTLGLEAMLDEVFTGLGMAAFFGMGELTYDSLTLEFLSSFEFDATNGVVQFRLMNSEVNISLAQFGELFGIIRPNEKLCGAPKPFTVEGLWAFLTCMTPSKVDVSRLHTNDVQHPGLRIVLRTMTGTILARPDVSKAKKLDVEIIGGYLNIYRQAPFRIDLAFAMATVFDKAAKGGYRSHEIGGLVTWIAKKYFHIEVINDYNAATTEVPYIDRNWFVDHHHWVKPLPQRRWGWLVQHNRWLPLPCDDLPPLVSLPEAADRRDHPVPLYYISLDLAPIEDAAAAVTPVAPVRSRRRPVESPPSSMFPEPTVAPLSFDGSYDPNSFSERRYIHQSLAQSLTAYGQHSFLVDKGYIPKDGPHPPYWQGIDKYPGTLFRDHGVDPASFVGNYGATYGGIAGQYLTQFGTGTMGYPAGYGGGGDEASTSDAGVSDAGTSGVDATGASGSGHRHDDMDIYF